MKMQYNLNSIYDIAEATCDFGRVRFGCHFT